MTTESGTVTRVACSTWADVLHALTPMTCYWADLDGLHLGAPPATLPTATHLWGFNGTDCWVRLRIEHDAFHLVRLGAQAASSGAPSEGKSLAATFTRLKQQSWTPFDDRVRQAELSGMPLEVEIVEVIGLAPLTFFSVVKP